MNDHLDFDRLFDKLEKMDDKLDAVHTKVEVVDTKLEAVINQVNDKDTGLAAAHSKHDKITGALKFGAWIVGVIGAYKMIKEAFLA